jgi:hypothetical protein
MSGLFGFKSSPNFFLTGIIFLLISVTIHFSVVLTRSENRDRNLTEHVAMLEAKVKELEKNRKPENPK